MDRGDLVPDEITIAMVRDRLEEDDAQAGFLLDGFPRNVPQAETLKKMLADWDTKLDVVLELVVDEDEVVRRLSGPAHLPPLRADLARALRPARPGRACATTAAASSSSATTTRKTIRHRLDVYNQQTQPLIAFYADEGILVGIDATGPVEEITGRRARRPAPVHPLRLADRACRVR